MSREITLPDDIRDLIETAVDLTAWDRNGWEEDQCKVLEWLEQFPREEDDDDS